MTSLAKMTKLQNLDIRMTQVTDTGLKELAEMKRCGSFNSAG